MVLSTEAAALLFLVVLGFRYTEFEEDSVRSLAHDKRKKLTECQWTCISGTDLLQAPTIILGL
jgi:hypothetical protein